MGTFFPEIFAALAAPFDREEVKSRTAHGGRVLHYITARTVMNRLDEVCGPEAWWDNYEFFGQTGCKCHLTLRMPDGTEVTKVGVGGVTPMPDESDTDKTGESDSFKRAAMKFGLGRYLYGDGVPRYVSPETQAATLAATPITTGSGLVAWIREQERLHGDGLLGTVKRWASLNGYPPLMKDWKPDQVSAGRAEAERLIEEKVKGDGAHARAPQEPSEPETDIGVRPRTGKALFGWIREQEKATGMRLMPVVVEWSRANGFPDRMLDWDADHVRLAWREVQDRLNVPPKGSAEDEPLDSPIVQQRQTLVSLVRKIAGTDMVSPEVVAKILAELAEEGRCAPITSVKLCTNQQTLGRYIVAAESRLQRQSEVEANV